MMRRLKAGATSEDPDAMQKKQDTVESLSRALMGREERMLSLVKETFSLEDLLAIKGRMIGTGLIGGKSVGMLLARRILRPDPAFAGNAEPERDDSFFIGSNIFHAYLEQNGWCGRELLHGAFPDAVQEQFRRMLAYFGPAPIMVRSSALSEDSFGDGLAGKYESCFCPNQGTPETRYQDFAAAVRKIFASTLNEEALADRRQRGLALLHAPLALLVQRVSGSRHGRFFFPDLAGIGLSHNPFVWRKGMDPKAGLLRLVFGLGTRAANGGENDYTRIAALDAPLINPYNRPEDVKRFSQSDVDVLNLRDNEFQTLPAAEVLTDAGDIPLDLIATRDLAASEYLASRGSQAKDAWILTFDKLFESTPFAKTMSRLLKTLEQAYRHPVEIEFTVNFAGAAKPGITLLRCRPCPTKGRCGRVERPVKIGKSAILLQQEADFMGGSRCQSIARIIYIDPRGYACLTGTEQYEIARITGRLNRLIGKREALPTLLLGPGRWGTTTPALGVPVRFSEIDRMTAIGEIAYRDGSKTLELSFGTHFFQDLVARDLFYLAIYPEKEGVVFNTAALKKLPNLFADLLPNDARFAKVVHVYDTQARALRLISDIVTQKLTCLWG